MFSFRSLWMTYQPVVVSSYLLTKGFPLSSSRHIVIPFDLFCFSNTVGAPIDIVHDCCSLRSNRIRENLVIEFSYNDSQLGLARYDSIIYPLDNFYMVDPSPVHLAEKAIRNHHYPWLRRLVADYPLTLEQQAELVKMVCEGEDVHAMDILEDMNVVVFTESDSESDF